MKYLRAHLTKEAKDLYNESYKTLKKLKKVLKMERPPMFTDQQN
jgi:hypothetical protein